MILPYWQFIKIPLHILCGGIFICRYDLPQCFFVRVVYNTIISSFILMYCGMYRGRVFAESLAMQAFEPSALRAFHALCELTTSQKRLQARGHFSSKSFLRKRFLRSFFKQAFLNAFAQGYVVELYHNNISRLKRH